MTKQEKQENQEMEPVIPPVKRPKAPKETKAEREFREYREMIEAKKARQVMPTDEELAAERARKKALEIVPTTFKQKWDNYWYHYKVPTIVIAVCVVLGASLVKTIMFPEKFDIGMLIATQYPLDSSEKEFDTLFAPYVADYDGDHKQKIYLNMIQLTDASMEIDPNLAMANQVKLAGSLGTMDQVLMLLDDFNYNNMKAQEIQFMDLSGLGTSPNIKKDRFYIKGTSIGNQFEEFDSVLDQFTLCIVDMNCLGEKYQKDKKFVQKHEQALETLQQIINDEVVVLPTTEK